MSVKDSDQSKHEIQDWKSSLQGENTNLIKLIPMGDFKVKDLKSRAAHVSKLATQKP